MRPKKTTPEMLEETSLLIRLQELPRTYLALARESVGGQCVAYAVPVPEKVGGTAWRIVAWSGEIPNTEETLLAYLHTGEVPDDITLVAVRPCEDAADAEVPLLLLADAKHRIAEPLEETRHSLLRSFLRLLREQGAMEVAAETFQQRTADTLERWEQTRHPARERFDHLFANASVGLFQITPDGSYIHANERMAALLGYDSVDDFLIDSLSSPERRYPMPDTLPDSQPLQRERDFVRRDGHSIRVLESLSAIRNREGEIVYYDGTLVDMTARHQAEEARERSESLLRTVLESATDAIYVKDTDGRYQMINSAGARIIGLPTSDIIGQDDRALMNPADAQAIRTQDQAVLERGVSITYERAGLAYATSHPPRTYLTTKDPFRDRTGKIVGLVGISRDISERKEFEERLRASEERYRHLFAVNPLPMFLFDPETLRFLDVNEAAIRHYGYTHDEFLGMTIHDLRPKEDRASVDALMELDADERAARLRSNTWRHLKKDGTVIDVEVASATTRLSNNREARIVLAHDVTERLAAERARHEYQARFEQSFHAAGIGMAVFSLDSVFMEVNGVLCEMLGYSEPELVGKSVIEITHEEDREECVRLLREATPFFQIDKRYLHRNGRVIRGLVTASLVRDDRGAPLYFIGQIQDITERWEADQRLRWQAYHDVLTQLPNRFRFEEALSQAFENAQTGSEKDTGIAVLLLDMDRFKRINDTLGHPAGDLMIQEVARRFRAVLPPGALLARMGGDEFTLMITSPNIKNDARDAARALLDALIPPLFIAGHEIFASGSIGISIYPRDGRDAQTLLKNADIALYRAKERSRGGYRFYTRVMSLSAARDLRLEAALQRAVGRGEMALFYQPQMALADRTIIGMEALVRWRHPEQGLLLPGQFIPMAEETGMIIPLGQWSLQEACRQGEMLRRNGYPLTVAVNLSPRQFSQMDIVGLVSETLAHTGLPPHLLELEITETTLMETGASALDRLHSLKSLGVRLSVDDFGTGYSSLSYLRHLPLDVLKIDRSFLESLPDDRESRAVTRALIEMSHSLGIFVIAEGVEREPQRICLAEMGCDALQGFLFCEPIPFEQIAERLDVRLPRGEPSPHAPAAHATVSP
jgi:diguanylate cyclase (GGDEF)-like protein/PAS domain S-box-containing protein